MPHKTHTHWTQTPKGRALLKARRRARATKAAHRAGAHATTSPHAHDATTPAIPTDHVTYALGRIEQFLLDHAERLGVSRRALTARVATLLYAKVRKGA